MMAFVSYHYILIQLFEHPIWLLSYDFSPFLLECFFFFKFKHLLGRMGMLKV